MEEAPYEWVRAFRASLFGLPPARAALASRFEFSHDEVAYTAADSEIEAINETLRTSIEAVNRILSGGTGR